MSVLKYYDEATSTWLPIAKGDKGDTGNTGATGATGATGPQGEPGAATTLSSLGITSTSSELNVLDGITATVTELNYTYGVTSNIQTQLNDKARAKIVSSITLASSSWSSSNYTISNANITTSSVITISPSSSMTSTQYDAVAGAKIIENSISTGQVVLKALGTVPTVDCPVVIVIEG